MVSTFKEVAKSVKSLDRQTAQFTDGFKASMKVVAAATVTAGAAFATFGVKSAAEIGAMNAQFEQVFGDMEAVAEKTVGNLSKEFGILPNRLKPMFSQTTSKFLGLGLDIEDAMNQATTATTLAADGAAFYDKSLTDVTSGLNSFINGSYEGGEAIGLFANETQLAEWASKNLGKEWKTLDEAGKQIIRLEYAKSMYEMSGATGQAARESMTLENQLGNVMSAFTNFSAAVMEPIMEPFIYALADTASMLNSMAEGIRDVNSWMAEHQSVMQATASIVGALVTSLIVYNSWLFLTGIHAVTVGGATTYMTGAMILATNAMAAFNAVMAFLTSPITLVIMGIGLLVAAYFLLTGNSEFLMDKINQLGSALVGMGFNMDTVNKYVALAQQGLQIAAEYARSFAAAAVVVGTELYNAFIAYLPTIIEYLKTFYGYAQQLFGYLLVAVQPQIDKFKAMGDAIKEAFSTGNFDALKQVAATLIPIIIGLFLTGIPKLLLVGYNILNAIAMGMGISVPELLIKIIEIITSVITQFISYLPMILQVGVSILLAIINGLIAALPSILGAIFLVISTLITTISTYLPMILNAGLQILLMLIQGIVTLLPALVNTAVTLITMIAQTLIGLLPVIISAGLEILFALINGILQVLPSLLVAAIEIIVALGDALVGALPIIIAAGIQLLLALIKGVVSILPQLIAMGVMLIIQLSAAVIKMLPQIISAGIQILLALIHGLIKTIPTLVGAIPQIISAIISAFGEVDWGAIGIDIIKGIASGIGTAAGALWDAAKSVLGGFKDKVLGFFGIHSPSRWMRDMVGINLTAGIGVGIDKGERSLIRTATSMSGALANAIAVPTVDLASNVSKANGSIKQTVQHNINNMNTTRMDDLLERIARGQTIVLDSGELVGATYPKYDQTGGNKTQLNERWGR